MTAFHCFLGSKLGLAATILAAGVGVHLFGHRHGHSHGDTRESNHE